ncbi:MAG: hypothetical protein JXR34_13610 [Bacteroidales bacterium]|nr:hypothetical protein [Bacteroidales bacterium]
MKNQNVLFALIVVIVFTFFACKKDESSTYSVDYKRKYYGDYNFHTEISYSVYGYPPGTQVYDTEGYVADQNMDSTTSSTVDSIIYVKVTSTLQWSLFLKPDGKVSGLNNSFNHSLTGEFIGNDILKLYIYDRIGLGGLTTGSVVGTRKK